MNKLDMAHDFVMNCIKNPTVTLKADDIQNIINNSWIYTDLMQAEADKREPKGFPEAILTKKPNGECAHFHTTLNRTECFDCGEVLKGTESSQLDWQPDWTQAPDWAVCWVASVDEFGRKTNGLWLDRLVMPNLSINYPSYWKSIDSKPIKAEIAELFSYQGDWKQSLRKRPQ